MMALASSIGLCEGAGRQPSGCLRSIIMSQNVGAPSDNTLFTRAEQWLLLIVGAVQRVLIALDFSNTLCDT